MEEETGQVSPDSSTQVYSSLWPPDTESDLYPPGTEPGLLAEPEPCSPSQRILNDDSYTYEDSESEPELDKKPLAPQRSDRVSESTRSTPRSTSPAVLQSEIEQVENECSHKDDHQVGQDLPESTDSKPSSTSSPRPVSTVTESRTEITEVALTAVTHLSSSKRKKKKKKSDKARKRKKTEKETTASKTDKSRDVQNQTVNSTQEANGADKTENYGLITSENVNLSPDPEIDEKTDSQINAAKENTTMALITKKPRSEPIDLENFDLNSVVLDIKPLSEYVNDKKQLYKEIFTLINKKEFKSLMPDSLKKYDPRDVRRWCLAEIEIMSRKRLKSIITATPITSSSDSESERETGDVTIENHAQIPDSSKKTPENHSVDGQIEQNELNLEEQKGLKESENLEESESKSNSGNSEPAEAEERQSNDSDQDSTHSVDENDIESDNDMRDNSDENSDRSDSDSEENDNVNQPVQAEIEQLPPEQNDYELFQDIFETPDQEEIEDLMTVKEKKEKQDVKAKDAKGKETTAKKVREEKTNEAQAEILELELRARVLQSFLRAQEKKQLAEKATEKAPE